MSRAKLRVDEWLARHGGAPARSGVLVRVGEETVVAAEVAASAGASMVVVSARAGAGHEWLEFARDSRLPVLVARATTARAREVVAASDFTDRRLPTFSWALRLGLATGGRVTLVHNIDDAGGRALGQRLGLPLPRAALSDLLDARKKELEALARGAPIRCEALLLQANDGVDGIAKVVAKKHAAILVVGARVDRRTRTESVSRLVSRVRSSVLIVPLDPRRPAP